MGKRKAPDNEGNPNHDLCDFLMGKYQFVHLCEILYIYLYI